MFGFVAGLVAGAFRATTVPAVQILFTLAGGLGAGTVLLVADFRRGRIVGHGNVRAGLGDQPVSKLAAIAILAVAVVAYALLVGLTAVGGRSEVVRMFAISAWATLLVAVFAVVVAPVAEELFFRGWLWTGLRRNWSALPTAAMTSALWLAVHLEYGIAALAVLLPVAVMLATARHFGQSVRAPIALHAIYNLLVLISPWILKEPRLI